MEKKSSKTKIFLLIIGIIITGSTEHITIPIMVTFFESLYFILIISSLHGCINYGLILMYLTKGKIKSPSHKKTIIIAGFLNALMSICFIYSANPLRTPVVIQSIFLGLAIIPTVFLRKFLIKKKIIYNKKFSIPSILLLFLSVMISTIPLYSEPFSKQSFWIIGYMWAIFLLSVDNTIQEKYITDTNDTSLLNKITLAFYTSVCQFCTLLSLFWVEYIFGYFDDPLDAFMNSFYTFFGDIKYFLLLELFILDCLALYLLSIYLNSISTNYNLVLTNVTNQSVAIFFAIFPNLNKGLKYPLYITIPDLFINLIGVVLWIKGEKKEDMQRHPSLEAINVQIQQDYETNTENKLVKLDDTILESFVNQ